MNIIFEIFFKKGKMLMVDIFVKFFKDVLLENNIFL